MNYLAHSFLAFSEQQIVGQFLEDYVKNNQRGNLPEEIQQGIILHRAIDTFTDSHPIISEAKVIYQPLVRLYSGAFVDVSLDYFLANSLSESDLKFHTDHVYLALRKYQHFFPISFDNRLNGMEKDNWLYNYKFDWGIKYSFQNVLNKAKYLEKDIPIIDVFLKNKDFLQEKFDLFFPELEAHILEINSKF
ncbi:acyl carrier protein phosphodiesterase [Halpernia frigidisoli]|uniref:Acyl carrier protein phosphodiesterase n=1 Tax=Halpernia frigidisoli TaxID=1125876 RepID=A0A1I3FQ19_9FLAO|nr:ACP phosphodiesterase [Halpernia frigidisoli]SFI13299.1 Acyl carrier protein phosphodiesterase [Halpernia frigidisoli]